MPVVPQSSAHNQERFQALLQQHKGILFKVSRAYSWNPADREDLSQEIVFQLWSSFARFDGRYRFSTWMYRVALNVAISFSRRETTRARHVASDGEEIVQSAPQPVASEPEEVALLYAFIERLDALNKALVLLYLDGNTYIEIAAVLGITATNAATKLNRIKFAMQREFNNLARAGGDGA